MRDVIDLITNWTAQGKAVALATVIQTWGSSPRGVGASMALTSDGGIAGSVSGGCVEGAVLEAGIELLKNKQPRLLHFGVADETAWEVGLSCGGTIDVFVRHLDVEKFQTLEKEINAGKSVASVMIIKGPELLLGQEMIVLEGGGTIGTLGVDLDARALHYAQSALTDGRPRRIDTEESVELFINVVKPSPTLIVVGGAHIAIPLTSLAKTLGYRTIVVDPRKMFGSNERFPHVDQLIQAWPDKAFEKIALTSSTAVAMLTHDPKIDDPALIATLNSPAFYVGALGSRKTHAKRLQRMREIGVSEEQLDRLHAPIGLNLGGRSPEEIALAVMAEIVQARNN
ncbi:MAG: XdhC family protein [Anaerolineales bacterium]|nr:XdhC family protein [Chloroflexota bacterium]MBL6981637.1 XdhC family protein [Anaerolineales bacterium]